MEDTQITKEAKEILSKFILLSGKNKKIQKKETIREFIKNSIKSTKKKLETAETKKGMTEEVKKIEASIVKCKHELPFYEEALRILDEEYERYIEENENKKQESSSEKRIAGASKRLSYLVYNMQKGMEKPPKSGTAEKEIDYTSIRGGVFVDKGKDERG